MCGTGSPREPVVPQSAGCAAAPAVQAQGGGRWAQGGSGLSAAGEEQAGQLKGPRHPAQNHPRHPRCRPKAKHVRLVTHAVHPGDGAVSKAPSPCSYSSATCVCPWRAQRGRGGRGAEWEGDEEDEAVAAGAGEQVCGRPGQPLGMGVMAWQRGWKLPSFVLRLTGTSRGVPGSDGRGRRPAGGITQCLPTQVRLQLLCDGSWDARRGGTAAGSARAERCIHHFQPLQGGLEQRGELGRRRRAPQKWQEGVQLSWSQTELSAEKLHSADFWPLAARGGCRRVS